MYPLEIFETPESWGNETTYAGIMRITEIMWDLRTQGGDWAGIDLDECKRWTLVEVEGITAVYRSGSIYGRFVPYQYGYKLVEELT